MWEFEINIDELKESFIAWTEAIKELSRHAEAEEKLKIFLKSLLMSTTER